MGLNTLIFSGATVSHLLRLSGATSRTGSTYLVRHVVLEGIFCDSVAPKHGKKYSEDFEARLKFSKSIKCDNVAPKSIRWDLSHWIPLILSENFNFPKRYPV